MKRCIIFGLFICMACNNASVGKKATPLLLNQIQMLGSHNSYKQAIQPALFQLLTSMDSTLFDGLAYEHIGLSAQLDLGIRKLELDILHDPKGGRFAQPQGNLLLQKNGIASLPYDEKGKMKLPGFKVMHVQDFDFRSNCLTLKDCLGEINTWSDAHPKHLPIVISFNAKTDNFESYGLTSTLPFTAEVFDQLDESIMSVFSKDKVIMPDDIRGNFTTLNEAVLAKQWPTLASSRGKVLFVLDEIGEKQDAYIENHSSLQGRVMFVNAAPGEPEAAFIICNDPITYQDSIQQMVKDGYLVRTRADAGTIEARKGDLSRFKAALSSGAHFISTDYYLPKNNWGTKYQVKLKDNFTARCNVISASQECDIQEILLVDH